ncbi:MAG TPA: glutamate mutase L, partial [Kineosporiaceae bacterium]|nr:glutamate mutase L [Kineosporiaceae bacterium]
MITSRERTSRGVVLCVDVGSTFTKAALVGLPDGALLATATHPTTPREVLDGVATVRAAVEESAGRRAAAVLACSSAGGGLRIAVVGYERLVTAEAGRRAALSAGGRVVHVHAGPLTSPDVDRLRATRPDVVLLVGGTDGGDADVLLANARRLGIARIPVPVVVAGNAEAAPQAAAELERRRRRVVVAANVLPRIGALEPVGARSAVRELFLTHVIGGKGLSSGPRFARLVRAATPDAVLSGVEVLAEVAGDVLVVDVGGATTDVYSVLTDPGDQGVAAGSAPAARTVEGDLGVRWSAPGVVAAALAEQLLAAGEEEELGPYAAAVAADPGRLPAGAADAELD